MFAAGDWNNGLALTAGHHTGQYVTGPNMWWRVIPSGMWTVHIVIHHVCLQQTHTFHTLNGPHEHHTVKKPDEWLMTKIHLKHLQNKINWFILPKHNKMCNHMHPSMATCFSPFMCKRYWWYLLQINVGLRMVLEGTATRSHTETLTIVYVAVFGGINQLILFWDLNHKRMSSIKIKHLHFTYIHT